ncbi:MAG TPA: alpha/beta hydrolase [Thermoanaerobaculia bacterium]|nr:alpha/beta hydrolase [Thermoanaerobaculia bacterium]
MHSCAWSISRLATSFSAAALAAIAVLGCHGQNGVPARVSGMAAARARHHDAVDATVASSDGVPIRYHTEGEGASALVFVHGWGCDRSHWTEQVAHFSADHLAVSLDLAGHGDSGKDRKSWTLQACGEDVRAVVLALDLRRVVLVGHSMGGAVILEAARLMPERVIGLVGVDTFHNVERRIDPAQAEALVSRWDKDFAGTAKEMVAMLLPKVPDPTFKARIEAQMAAAPPDIALPLLRAQLAYDLATAFERVHAPIRVINTTSPTDVEAGHRHCPGFAAVDLSPLGLGHFPMITAPALFDEKLAEVLRGLETAL